MCEESHSNSSQRFLFQYQEYGNCRKVGQIKTKSSGGGGTFNNQHAFAQAELCASFTHSHDVLQSFTIATCLSGVYHCLGAVMVRTSDLRWGGCASPAIGGNTIHCFCHQAV